MWVLQKDEFRSSGRADPKNVLHIQRQAGSAVKKKVGASKDGSVLGEA